jgi:hypothetical protein
MPINGTARAIATGLIGMRSVENLERRGLVVQRAADTMLLRAALAETVGLIHKRVSPRDSKRVLDMVVTALKDDAGTRLHELLMRESTTIEDVRTLLLGAGEESAREKTPA